MPVSNAKNPYFSDKFGRITWALVAEAANVIKVTGTLKTPGVVGIGERVALRVWLTQSATTKAIAPVAPSGTVVIAAKGSVIAIITAKLVFDIITDASGEFDFNITDATAGNWYMAALLPSGEVVVSDVIDFAQPVVASLSPTGGTTAGGTALTITGTGFESGATVDIGGAAATSVVVVSATSITCVTPARSAGARAVTVTTPNGVSNTDVTFLYA